MAALQKQDTNIIIFPINQVFFFTYYQNCKLKTENRLEQIKNAKIKIILAILNFFSIILYDFRIMNILLE